MPVAGLALVVALAILGCNSGAAMTLDPESQTWSTYLDATLGYSVRHPEVFHARPEGDGNTLFRFAGGGVPVLVRYTTAAEGRRRGAWFGQPAAEAITLAGIAGHKYAYEHWDGPFSTRTVAYVIPWNDRWLGLEFRTPGELSPVQERMLDSFRLP
jgi:hypothetical protein